MNQQMRVAQTRLIELLQADQVTSGMYVRVHGDHLIAGRNEQLGAESMETDDRVRFTRLGINHYGVSVKRHTGPLAENPLLRDTRRNGCGGVLPNAALGRAILNCIGTLELLY